MARQSATAAVAMLAARIPAAGSTRPPLGRATPDRRKGAGDRRIGLLATWSRHRRAPCR